MIQFFQDITVNPFLLSGLVAGVLASVASGIIGPYVITKRVVFMAGAIAHTVAAGVGAVYYMQGAWGWFESDVYILWGALATGLLAAVIMGLVQEHVHERLDTLIGALWSVGMAVGVLLVKLTPGYGSNADLFSFLFGNISMVSWDHVRLMLALDVVLLVVVALWHKRLLAVCLDEEYARLQGVNVLAVNLVLLSLVAVTVVLLIYVVGLILVMALLSLPAAIAGHHTRRFGSMIVVAIAVASLVTTLPRIAVYAQGRIAPEPAIVIAAALLYLLSLGVYRWRRRRRSVGSTARTVPTSRGIPSGATDRPRGPAGKDLHRLD